MFALPLLQIIFLLSVAFGKGVFRSLAVVLGIFVLFSHAHELLSPNRATEVAVKQITALPDTDLEADITLFFDYYSNKALDSNLDINTVAMQSY